MDDFLTRQLQRTAEELESPVDTDVQALLTRARTDRRRHRIRATAATVGVTAAAITASTLGVQALVDKDDARGPDKPSGNHTQVAAALGDQEIVDRCQPQVAKYADYPMYAVAGVTWTVGNDRDYTAGDIVPLVDPSGGSNPVLCLLPEEGHTQDPVPFDTFTPDPTDTKAILQLCDASHLPRGEFDAASGRTLPPAGTTRDLRDGHVLAIDDRGPAVEALVESGDELFACNLSPVTWDAGMTDVEPAHQSDQDLSFNGSTTGPSSKSVVPEEAAYYRTAGSTDPRARTIEVSIEGGHTERYPVREGHYAILHQETGPGGLRPGTYSVLDAEGQVLFDGQID